VALGTNAVYSGSFSDVEGVSEVSGYPVTALKPDDFQLVQRSYHAGLKQGDHTYNLQLSVVSDAVELASNAHTELQNRDSTFAQAAARKFHDHRRLTESLMANIFKVSIEHAFNNA
jgi:hypothetical protein